jgi:hypothetical protein
MDKTQQEWLQTTLNQGRGELSDDDLLALLGDDSMNDDSLHETIRFVETWLSKKAGPHLLRIVSCDYRSRAVRAQAAYALAQILDSETILLLRVALTPDSPSSTPRG